MANEKSKRAGGGGRKAVSRDQANAEYVAHEDGVYLHLPDEDYQADEALSSHQLMTLLRSPPDWWWGRKSNPWYEEPPVDARVKAGRSFGKALHCYVLDGKDEFLKRYKLPAAEPHGLLRTMPEIKEWVKARCEQLERPLLPLSGMNKSTLEQYARELGAPLMTDWKASAGGDKVEILQKDLDVIENIDSQIKRHRDLGALMSAGLPEVSIFWTSGGVRFKARLDMLSPGVVIDLKSFANYMRRDLVRAVCNEIADRSYNMQAAWYLHAARRARTLPLQDAEPTPKTRACLEGSAPRNYVYLFTKTLNAPSIFVIPTTDKQDDIVYGRRDCLEALKAYRAWKRVFGLETPWLMPTEIVKPPWPERISYSREAVTPETGNDPRT